MDITARVGYTFDRTPNTPENIIWSGVLEYWMTSPKTGQPERAIKVLTSMRMSKAGRFFLSMPYRQKVEGGRLVPVLDKMGKYSNLVELSFTLNDIGVAAIEAHIDQFGNLGDRQRHEQQAQAAREEAPAEKGEFDDLPF